MDGTWVSADSRMPLSADSRPPVCLPVPSLPAAVSAGGAVFSGTPFEEREPIPGPQQVRVGDEGVHLPELGPQPGVAIVILAEIPEGVPGLDPMLERVPGPDLELKAVALGGLSSGNGQEQNDG